jgi:ssDNA-binding Zn-finger/Zn-ribbon topoisomerase 1
MKRTLVVTRKVVSGVLYPYNSDKTNAKKSKISTKLDVYSHRRAHRLASCSAGVICRGFGASNMEQTAVNVVTTSLAPSNSWKFYTGVES